MKKALKRCNNYFQIQYQLTRCRNSFRLYSNLSLLPKNENAGLNVLKGCKTQGKPF